VKFIDEGNYGKVYLAQSQSSNCIYSLKRIYRSIMNPKLITQFAREVAIQSYLRHPHIVKLYDYFVEDDSAYLVMEACLDGNLYNYLRKHGPVSEAQAREWVRQLCIAAEYMHKHDVVHRDLKP
jgi:serine/threonine protein kinase